VLTDDRGVFGFTNLQDNRYTISATKLGYVEGAYGASGPQRLGTPIVVSANFNAHKVGVTVYRGAVISGRVSQQDGQPAADVRVIVGRVSQSVEFKTPIAGTAVTDERGYFRIFSLPPGRFFVAALQHSRNAPAGRERRIDFPVFFPQSRSVENAGLISLAVAQEITDIHLSLPEEDGHLVSGRIETNDPTLLKSALTVLTLRDEPGRSLISVALDTKEDGTFAIRKVPSGSYILSVRATAQTEAHSIWWAEANLDVRSDDVLGVRPQLTRGLSVGGHVRLPPTIVSEGVPIHLILLSPSTSDERSHIFEAPIGRDGTFVFHNVRPASYLVSASCGDALATRDCGVLGVRRAGLTVTEVVLDVNSDLEGLQVELTDHSATLAGMIQDRSGGPVTDRTVAVTPTDGMLRRFISGSVVCARPAADGTYVINDLLPAEYALAVVADMDTEQRSDGRLLDVVLSRGVRTTVRAATANRLSLVVDSAARQLRVLGESSTNSASLRSIR
jgi:hypothetical protein